MPSAFFPPLNKSVGSGMYQEGEGMVDFLTNLNKLNKRIPCSRVLLEKLIITQLVQFCTLYGT
jgi:hypothetical protein